MGISRIPMQHTTNLTPKGRCSLLVQGRRHTRTERTLSAFVRARARPNPVHLNRYSQKGVVRAAPPCLTAPQA